MTWNYRVLQKEYNGETYLRIHEVYYSDHADHDHDHDDRLSWTTLPVEPGGEDIEELRANLEHMLEALNKPIMIEVNNTIEELKET